MQTLSTDELVKVSETGEQFLLINVLPVKEFSNTMIPGAISVPGDDPEFVTCVKSAAGGMSLPVIVYSAGPECSKAQEAGLLLDQAGFEDVFVYKAGARGWSEARQRLGAGEGKSNPSMPAFSA